MNACESAVLTVAKEDELTEIRNDRELKLQYLSIDVSSF